MPELRKDPIVDRWIIIAPERAKRPMGSGAGPTSGIPACPFCAGNETMTPPEVLVLRNENDATNWCVRVVTNKYPAVVQEPSSPEVTDQNARSGFGAHEVIVESPHHLLDVALLEEPQMEAILRAYRERMLDLQTDRRFRYVLIYKNQGAEAGATLEHIHSQLVALPFVPKNVLEELAAAKDYYRANGECIFCDLTQKESRKSARVVTENTLFIALCPFAPRFPYEIWILPKTHKPFFERNTQADECALASLLRETLTRMNLSLANPHFNYVIHSSPPHTNESNYFHWHIEIIPKLIRVGGFEWGSGSYINPVTPEESARLLRQALL